VAASPQCNSNLTHARGTHLDNQASRDISVRVPPEGVIDHISIKPSVPVQGGDRPAAVSAEVGS
jgi:hypothetical protein